MSRRGAQGAGGVRGGHGGVRRVHLEQHRTTRLDEVHVGESLRGAGRELARRLREPAERRDGAVVVECGDRERRERVPERQRQAGRRHGETCSWPGCRL